MFFDDRRKAVTTILSKRSSKGDRLMGPTPMKPEVMKSEGGEIDPRHLAAQDIIGAHYEKSPERLMEALTNFIDLHLHNQEGNVPQPPSHEVRIPLAD